MATYDYQIGASYGALANVEGLSTPVPAPKSSYRPYASSVPLGDGSFRGTGYPVATWRFGYLTAAQRNMLRTFCTGKSASVYIKTRITDAVSGASDAYKIFTAIMVWPDEEERQAGRRLEFEIEFRHLVVYTP